MSRPAAELADRIYERARLTGKFRLLRDREADIAGVLCVIDREAGGRENLATEGLDLRAL
jgi:orotate phosphoribosyltransferase